MKAQIILATFALCLVTACDTGSSANSRSSEGGDSPNHKNQTGAITLTQTESVQVLSANGKSASEVLATISDLVTQRTNRGESHSLDDLKTALDASFTINCLTTCNIQKKEN